MWKLGTKEDKTKKQTGNCRWTRAHAGRNNRNRHPARRNELTRLLIGRPWEAPPCLFRNRFRVISTFGVVRAASLAEAAPDWPKQPTAPPTARPRPHPLAAILATTPAAAVSVVRPCVRASVRADGVADWCVLFFSAQLRTNPVPPPPPPPPPAPSPRRRNQVRSPFR